MLGVVTRFVGGDRVPAGRDDDAGDDRPSSRLYECPDCGSVYIAADLEACRSCRTAVEPVATERDLGFGSAD